MDIEYQHSIDALSIHFEYSILKTDVTQLIVINNHTEQLILNRHT